MENPNIGYGYDEHPQNRQNNTRIQVCDGYLYIINEASKELEVYSVKNPYYPILVNKVELCGEPKHIVICYNYAYVACGEAGVMIFNISNPHKIKLVNAILCYNVVMCYVCYCVTHVYIYVITNKKVIIFKTSDQLNMTEEQTLDFDNICFGDAILLRSTLYCHNFQGRENDISIREFEKIYNNYYLWPNGILEGTEGSVLKWFVRGEEVICANTLHFDFMEDENGKFDYQSYKWTDIKKYTTYDNKYVYFYDKETHKIHMRLFYIEDKTFKTDEWLEKSYSFHYNLSDHAYTLEYAFLMLRILREIDMSDSRLFIIEHPKDPDSLEQLNFCITKKRGEDIIRVWISDKYFSCFYDRLLEFIDRKLKSEIRVPTIVLQNMNITNNNSTMKSNKNEIEE